MSPSGGAGTGWRAIAGYGLLIALGLAVFVAPFASSLPDGLDAVATRLGFEHEAAAPTVPAPVPDYRFPGMKSAAAATALAGAIGTVVVFGLALLLGRTLTWRHPQPDQSSGH